MADSPFCRNCWDRGKVGQTYRVSGQPKFRCGTCKETFHEGLFFPWELAWRTDNKVWQAGMDERTFNKTGKKMYDDQKKRISEIEGVK